MQAGTGIEQKNVITASHLDADGIPAVFSEVFT
ncbi:metal dependent beta lactamase protein [Agrobacterium sp. ATCC 31749]|nr:metal dependent beta lactamase protein [Agrobacterium sp. ATCC 31749]